jgi:hypothetical protein
MDIQSKSPLEFKEWIMQFLKDDTPFGDLARDIASDHYDFPSSNQRQVIDRYLDMEKMACENAMLTFRKAFDNYEDYVKSISYRMKQ